MGLLSRLFSPSPPSITDDQLIPVLTKGIEEDWDNETVLLSQMKFPEKLSCRFYSIDPSRSYFDEAQERFYGWIQLMCEEELDEGLGYGYYLVSFSSIAQKYKVIFSFRWQDKQIASPTFAPIEIENFENGLVLSLNAIRRSALLNNYTNPPPYVFFAKLIKNPN